MGEAIAVNPARAVTLTWMIAAGHDERGTAPGARATAADRPLSDLDDVSLVQACLAGRPNAFDLIVERHRRPIFQLCYRFVHNHEDASDLSQETFLRAYRGLERFRREASLKTWLYRIGVNVCLTHVSGKGLRTEPIDEGQHLQAGGERADEGLVRAERAARVRAAIGGLPEKQKTTLILRMYHDMSHEEIAGVLGCTVGAVKANFFHALGNLKKRLGDPA